MKSVPISVSTDEVSRTSEVHQHNMKLIEVVIDLIATNNRHQKLIKKM